MSSVSLRFSRFEVRACTEASGPSTSQSMSWMWMAWVVEAAAELAVEGAAPAAAS